MVDFTLSSVTRSISVSR